MPRLPASRPPSSRRCRPPAWPPAQDRLVRSRRGAAWAAATQQRGPTHDSRPPPSTRPRTSSIGDAAATSCRRSCRRAQGRRGWLREAKRRLEAERAARRGRCRARGRSGSRRPSGAWRRSCGPSASANAAYEAYRARGRDEGRAALRPPAGSLPAAGDAGRADQRHRPGLARRQDAARLGAGLQRASRGQRAPDRRRRRDRPSTRRLRAPRTDGRRDPTRTRARPGSATRPTSCSPTPATGTSARWSALVDRGIQVLVPPDAGLRKGTRPGWDGGLYDFMRRVLATTAAASSTANAKS